MWPGQAQSLKVAKVLFSQKTDFQDLTIFRNDGPWGTVMTLDGAIQLTDKDEFAYHEMMAHTPLHCHILPTRVLIVGGGDGGVLREVMKHPSVEHCDLVDIDGAVISQSKIFFPAVAVAFDNPRVNVTVGDGVAFVQQHRNEYDVIIVDSSDPEGPASELFGSKFYADVYSALKPGGVACFQGESLWLHKDLISRVMASMREIGFTPKYGVIQIPTYPCGSIGCIVASRDGADVSRPLKSSEASPTMSDLKYYSTDVHRASFVLPRFAASLNAI